MADSSATVKTCLGPAFFAEWQGDILCHAVQEVFPVLSDLDSEPLTPHVRFRLSPSRGGAITLQMNDLPLCALPSAGHLAPIIEKVAATIAIRLAPDWLALHAGMIGMNDRYLLLPAEPRSGKSTLCLALSQAGWTYAGDDLVFYHPTRHVYLPFVKALTLKEGSFPLLPAKGTIHCDSARGDIRYFPPERYRLQEIHADSVCALVTPMYDPAAPRGGESLPLAPELTALALVQQLVGGPARGHGALEWIRDLSTRPAYILRYSCTEDSIHLARRAMMEADT